MKAYSEVAGIDARKLQAVANTLRNRIAERFGAKEPGLLEHATDTIALIGRAPVVRRKIALISALSTIAVTVLVVGFVVLCIWLVGKTTFAINLRTVDAETMQGLDALRNIVIFVAVSLWGAFQIPVLLCRRILVSYLDTVIAVVARIRLAQQVKDPERLFHRGEVSTKSSPQLGGTSSPLLMDCWLDYAAELAEILEILGSFVVVGSSDRTILEKTEALAGAVRTQANAGGRKRHTLVALEQRLDRLTQNAVVRGSREAPVTPTASSTTAGDGGSAGGSMSQS